MRSPSHRAPTTHTGLWIHTARQGALALNVHTVVPCCDIMESGHLNTHLTRPHILKCGEILPCMRQFHCTSKVHAVHVTYLPWQVLIAWDHARGELVLYLTSLAYLPSGRLVSKLRGRHAPLRYPVARALASTMRASRRHRHGRSVSALASFVIGLVTIGLPTQCPHWRALEAAAAQLGARGSAAWVVAAVRPSCEGSRATR